MSLFGEDDVPARAKQSSSLFDDDVKPASKPGNSLFADDLDTSDSPWAFPSPKKAGRGALVKSLLPASDVPDAYIDAFDALLDAGSREGTGVSVTGVKKLLGDSGVSGDKQSRILEVVLPSGQEGAGLGRNEFNVVFALIGLAQEGEDITLDSVDERKRSKQPASRQSERGTVLTSLQICPYPRWHCPGPPSQNRRRRHLHLQPSSCRCRRPPRRSDSPRSSRRPP